MKKAMTGLVVVAAFLGTLSCGPGGEDLHDDALLGDMDAPVRLETRAATFVVREAMAKDFALLIAGEATQHVYFATAD